MADLPEGILDADAFAERMAEIFDMMPPMNGAQYAAFIGALHASAWPEREQAVYIWNVVTVEIYRVMRAGTWPKHPSGQMGEVANERPI